MGTDLLFFIVGVVLFVVIGCLNLPIIVVGLALGATYITYLSIILSKSKLSLHPNSPGLERHRIASVDSLDGVYIVPGAQAGARPLRKSRLESVFENESVT